MNNDFYKIINLPSPSRPSAGFALSPNVDAILYVQGVRPSSGGDPDDEVVNLFERLNPEYTLYQDEVTNTVHVEGDDERCIPDDKAQLTVVRSGVLCVWLPDFIEGSDADDGSRCANGGIPCRLFFVFPRD